MYEVRGKRGHLLCDWALGKQVFQPYAGVGSAAETLEHNRGFAVPYSLNSIAWVVCVLLLIARTSTGLQ